MKRAILILSAFIFILFGITPGIPQTNPPKGQIYYFYSQDCEPCKTIYQSYLPTLKTVYPFLEIQAFDVGDPIHYEALLKLEKRFGKRESELPVLLIGDHFLSGEREVMERLDPLLMEYQAKGGIPPVSLDLPSGIASTPPQRAEISLSLTYFHQKGCPKCDRANALLKYLVGKYPGLKVEAIDLNTPEGKRLNEVLSNRLQVPSEKRLLAPAIFIGNEYLPPEEIELSRLETLLAKYSSDPSSTPPFASRGPSVPTQEEIAKAEETMIERFKSFGLPAILVAGLVEGLNPCALATLVFFISYLTMIGQGRKQILMVGLGFSGSAFLTHLLLGLGLLGFIQHLSFLPVLSRAIYLVTFLLSLFLAILSLYDYIQLKKGKPSKMKLQAPDFLKRRIHKVIRARGAGLETIPEGQPLRLLLVAIALGFLVTLFLSTCTSQVYLPTLLFVTQFSALREKALFYLVLYNLVYVLPLLGIFGIVYWGVTSQQLALFLQRRASTLKLITALFFFALAGILIFTLL
ncbi:MAG: glutaredoxin [Desulfobacterota bacterium]|nr:glutaredoxin [Thermodesulfobacteriota bacterium]